MLLYRRQHSIITCDSIIVQYFFQLPIEIIRTIFNEYLKDEDNKYALLQTTEKFHFLRKQIIYLIVRKKESELFYSNRSYRDRILSCIENPQYQLQVNCVGDRDDWPSIDLRYILPVHRLGIFSFTKIINFHLIGTYKLDLLEVCKLFYCSLPPDDLSVFSSLQVFELTHCSTITDVSALAHIPNLTLHQCWNITNIDVLTHNNRLNINLCVNIEKISLSDHPRDEVKIGRLFKLLEVVGKVKKVLLYDIPILSQISLPNDVKELNILEAESLISLDNVPHTQFISLESCENFTEISPSLQVKMLEMKECGSIESIKSLQFLEKLKLTSLENLRNIEDLPSLITLQVDNCDSLQKVTNLPLCKKYGKRFRR